MWKLIDSVPVFLFGDSPYPLLPFIMMEFSGGGNIQERQYSGESSSAINGLMQKEKIPEQSLALALSFEKRVQPARSNLSFKSF